MAPAYGGFSRYGNFSNHVSLGTTSYTTNRLMPVAPAAHSASSITDSEALKPYIVGQVEYYFSVENLVRDAYFRRQMDGDGWIPLAVLASFPRVRALTSDIKLLRDALLNSHAVEVDGFRIRKRDGWAVWVFPEEQRMSHAQL